MIYPQTCSICGKLDTKSLCNKCKIKLEKQFEFRTDNYEKDINKNFMKHHYFFKYENLIRSQIISFKFHEKPYIYKTIGRFLEKNQKNLENLKKYDIIVIVPISKRRKKERGYNQSELIAKEISKIIDVPIATNILYKIRDTVAQSSLNKKEREENAKGVYSTKNYQKIKDKKILLFDDIYTTGSTINECAKMLLQSGINKKQIGILTIAKD